MDNKREPFLSYKGLKSTVQAPFHNVGKGQKRSLQKSQKKRAKISVYIPFLQPKKDFMKKKKVRTQKQYRVTGKECNLEHLSMYLVK